MVTRIAGGAFAATLVTLAAATALAGTVEGRFARPSVEIGDQVELLLRYRGGTPSSGPDVSALRSDFEILGTRQIQRSRIINGRADQSLDFVVTLSPLHEGQISVPPISVGDAETGPLTLEVAERSSPLTDGSTPDVFMTAEIDEEAPYVQGQVTYTVRLFDGGGLTGGEIVPPRAPGAIVEPMGEDRSYEKTVNGRRYRVIERRFAVFPQASGELTLSPARFEGRASDPDARSPFDSMMGGSTLFDRMMNDPFFKQGPFAGMGGFPKMPGFGGSPFDSIFGGGRPVRLAAAPLTLAVKPRPAAASGGWWLPAEEVELLEAWNPDPPVFRVGETIERTVAIRAKGLTGDQLPDPGALFMPEVPGLSQYAEPSADRTGNDGTDTMAIRQQTISVVPKREGRLVMPPIEVEWWDVDTDEKRVATLPGFAVDVLAANAPAPAGADAGRPRPLTDADRAALAAAAAAANAPVAEATPDTGTSIQDMADGAEAVWQRVARHPWSAAGGLAAILLVAGGALSWRRLRPGGPAQATAPRHPAPRATSADARGAAAPATGEASVAANALERACAANEPRAAAAALVRWGRARWPEDPPASAGAVAHRVDHDGLADAVAGLNAHLYGGDTTPWTGATLLEAFKAARKAGDRRDRSRPGALPNLYPAR